MRQTLPPRRRSWTQKVHIVDAHGQQQTFYLGFGEYEDGKLGEIWIDAAKEGTFVRGILGTLARVVSLALQSGVNIDELVKVMSDIHFPPNGTVEGSEVCVTVSSLSDWIAKEIKAYYSTKETGVA